MSESKVTDIKKKSILPDFLTRPNAYVIIFILIILATIATWIIPAGQYDRVQDPISGRTVVDSESFTKLESSPVGIFQLLQAIPKGIRGSVGIIAFIFVISGAIQIVRGTGAMDAGIMKLVKKLKGKDMPLLVILTFLLQCWGQPLDLPRRQYLLYR